MSSTNKKYDFSGKVALITGSNSGIGAAIALQFAQYGAQVIITGRELDTLEKVAKQIELNGHCKPLKIAGDLLNESLPDKLINETIEKFGRLDLLVNNAGGGTPNDNFSNENLIDAYDKIYGLNVRSVIRLIQLAIPHLEKTQGNIINISSISALKPYSILYSSSKAALDMITKTSAQELGPKRIRVNSINPGPVITRIGRSFGFGESLNESVIDKIKDLTLLKRVAYPVEIANLASFLASSDAQNITGAIIVSDSGVTLQKFDSK